MHMTPRSVTGCTILLVLALVASASQADAVSAWRKDAALVKTAGDQGLHLAVVSDGVDGAVVVWHNRLSSQILMQRLDSRGNKLWGTPRAVANTRWDKFLPSAAADGQGGVITAWIEGRKGLCTPAFWGECDVYSQRHDAAGLPLWNTKGMPVALAERNQGTSGIALAGDGKGGVFLAWEDARPPDCCKVFAQHLGSDGKPLWKTDGLRISPEPTLVIGPMDAAPRIAGDGKGGAIIAWINNQVDPNLAKPTLNVQRVSTRGKSLWAEGGVPVGHPSHGSFSMAGDGFGGVLLAFTVLGADGFAKVAGQRVNASGEPLWGSEGVVAGASTYYQEVPDIVADGTGGAILVWVDHRNYDPTTYDNSDIFAQRFSASGVPQWPSAGLPLCTLPGPQDNPRLVADGRGGVIVVWRDCRDYPDRDACFDGADIYAQHVTAGGTQRWRTNGMSVTKARGTQGVPYGMPPRNSLQMTSDLSGGAILAWPDGRNGFCGNAWFMTECDVYAQRILDRLPNLRPYTPPGWSDRLVVSKTTGTTTDDSPLHATDFLYVDWAMINNGAETIDQEFCTSLLLDGVLVKDWCTGSLGASETATVLDHPLGNLAAGTHALKIVADRPKLVQESSEQDNSYTKILHVE